MDSRKLDRGEDTQKAETPDDVAILYSWANLHGAKYRDFSASRREYRAQIRHRAAESLRERELQAQAEAESAAASAERAALAAKEVADSQDASDSQMLRMQSLRSAEAAARRAVAERVEAARRAEAAASAAAAARREEREIAEAHASAQRQASNYAESDIRRRNLAGPQPRYAPPGQTSDPYMPAAGYAERGAGGYGDSETGRIRAARDMQDSETLRLSMPRDGSDAAKSVNFTPRPRGYHPDQPSGLWNAGQTPAGKGSAEAPAVRDIGADRNSLTPAAKEPAPKEIDARSMNAGTGVTARSGLRPAPESRGGTSLDSSGPAWLYASQPPARPRPSANFSPNVDVGTLQDSRERVAARWFALKGVFDQPGQEPAAVQATPTESTRTPLLAVFSLAGGVGKTSLVATLGRALSSKGEKVVLTDTTSHGLLPFYFGARELRPGIIRTFSPPSGSTDAPIYLVSYDVDEKAGDAASRDAITDEILGNSLGNHRVVLDLSVSSSWILKKFANLHPTVVVPVAPDMNSVISLQAVERFFRGITDSEGRAMQPYYLLNQFDTSLPLHLDVREVFRRQLGERLLPFVIRRSPAVSEALAEGMTVVDYAPEAPVSQDYLEAAAWLRSVSAPATAGFRNVRWSER